MLKSSRIPVQSLTHSIAFLRPDLPTRRDVTVAEAGGAPRTWTSTGAAGGEKQVGYCKPPDD